MPVHAQTPIAFGDVEDALTDLINAAGYDGRQFYIYPGGGAMFTRVDKDTIAHLLISPHWHM